MTEGKLRVFDTGTAAQLWCRGLLWHGQGAGKPRQTVVGGHWVLRQQCPAGCGKAGRQAGPRTDRADEVRVDRR